MPRRLTPEELALWQRVIETVRPIDRARRTTPMPAIREATAATETSARPDAAAATARTPRARPPQPARAPAETLDASWDRRLASGRARPDRVIDLHGLNRARARDLLLRAIDRANEGGERLLLVITGKGSLPGPAPADLAEGRPARGAIRADLPRWLGEAQVSARIAAVRQAHPRDGGDGAVYLVLKRRRPAP